ncbi:MAG TPA: DUF3499 domain-containing protein [Lapillicoccus sp.]
MLSARRCSRTGCTELAVATLTYVYADSTAVVGPLATQAEPHSYDLCNQHAHRLTAPRGWEVMRLSGEYAPPPPTSDDLLALANAVREAGRPRPAVASERPDQMRREAGTGAVEVGRRGHLRVLRDS